MKDSKIYNMNIWSLCSLVNLFSCSSHKSYSYASLSPFPLLLTYMQFGCAVNLRPSFLLDALHMATTPINNKHLINITEHMIPVAMWSKVSVCSHMIAGITGLNHAEDTDICLVFVVCCVCNVPCEGLITCSEESYWVCACIYLCVCVR